MQVLRGTPKPPLRRSSENTISGDLRTASLRHSSSQAILQNPSRLHLINSSESEENRLKASADVGTSLNLTTENFSSSAVDQSQTTAGGDKGKSFSSRHLLQEKSRHLSVKASSSAQGVQAGNSDKLSAAGHPIPSFRGRARLSSGWSSSGESEDKLRIGQASGM
jgi:hypothetical protein